MSYILDALRKADAQRARDPARGIHAQPATPVAAADPGPRRRGTVVAAALSVLILGVTAWLWLQPSPVAAPPAAPVAVIAPVVAPVLRVEPPPVAQPAAPAAEVLPPPPAPQAAVTATPKPAAAPVVPPVAPAVPAAPAAAERTYSLAELPADVQQALPKFSVSGGVYSENVAQRMLVVNGQVFNEGSEIAAGVVLEQIRPRVALLKFRGLRIAQPY
jgi:general secretion pathway protein B